MRKLFSALVIMALALPAPGQRSIDKIFEKYSDSEGFITLTLNGNILKFLDSSDNDYNENNHSWTDSVTEIRILAEEKENMNTANFYDMVIKDIDRSQYEEFMSVKKSDQDLVMLVRLEGNRIREFLLIGGGEDNLVIQIKGNLTREDAKKFSSAVKKDHDLNLISEHN